jgi:hypothetical protein
MNKTSIILLCAIMTATVCSGQHHAPSGPAQTLVQIAALEDDLNLLNQQIHCAEDEMIEYMRLHDILRVRIRAEAERQKLELIVNERIESEHTLLMLEAKHPFLTDTNAVASVAESATLQHEHKELKHTITVLTTAEFQWQSKNLLGSLRNSDIKYLEDRLNRFENTRKETADTLHSLRMKNELKSRLNKSLQHISEGRKRPSDNAQR